MYNRRTWLNKSDSPSLGNVTAFDGDIKYSEGIERTTFLAVSDCSKTIKIIKNTENIEDFIDKIKLLKKEIELFINHLENKSMKITDFKKGDLIVVSKLSDTGTWFPYECGEIFIFSEIKYDTAYMIRFNKHNGYKLELFEGKISDAEKLTWDYFESPDILRNAIIEKIKESINECKGKGDIFKESIFKTALSQF